jgi:hypothetical protein
VLQMWGSRAHGPDVRYEQEEESTLPGGRKRQGRPNPTELGERGRALKFSPAREAGRLTNSQGVGWWSEKTISSGFRGRALPDSKRNLGWKRQTFHIRYNWGVWENNAMGRRKRTMFCTIIICC